MDTIDKILEQREAQYGSFSFVARTAQEIKSCIFLCVRSSRYDFMSDQVESLDMIASKISRILNGNPNHIDNWDDIAGYAKLVADRLRQEAKEDEQASC